MNHGSNTSHQRQLSEAEMRQRYQVKRHPRDQRCGKCGTRNFMYRKDALCTCLACAAKEGK